MTKERTQQDNDITLYTLDELKTIDKRYRGNSTGWHPFNHKEVKAEIRRREGKPDFLQEWNEEQFATIKKRIAQHFSFKPMTTNKGRYPAMYLGWQAIADRLGLAYTSSSSYAGYWACNEDAINNKHQQHRYVGFAISTDGKCYGILWDKDENEIILPL